MSRQGPAAKSKLSSQSGASPINGQNSAFSIEKYRLAAGAGLETPTEMTALYCWEHMIAIGNIRIAPEQTLDRALASPVRETTIFTPQALFESMALARRS